MASQELNSFQLVLTKAAGEVVKLKPYLPKKPDTSAQTFSQLTTFLEKLTAIRVELEKEKRSKLLYCRFIAPVQMGTVYFNLVELTCSR